MILVQYIYGFLSLGWQVYKFVQEAEKEKLKRKVRCSEFKDAIRVAKDTKDTTGLENLFYKLGFRSSAVDKLPDVQQPEAGNTD